MIAMCVVVLGRAFFVSMSRCAGRSAVEAVVELADGEWLCACVSVLCTFLIFNLALCAMRSFGLSPSQSSGRAADWHRIPPLRGGLWPVSLSFSRQSVVCVKRGCRGFVTSTCLDQGA